MSVRKEAESKQVTDGSVRTKGKSPEQGNREKSNVAAQSATASGQPAAGNQTQTPNNDQLSSNPPFDREGKKDLQRLQKKFHQVEEQIALATKTQTLLEAELGHSSTYSNPQTFADTERKYKAIKIEGGRLNKQYEELFEKIMELENESK